MPDKWHGIQKIGGNKVILGKRVNVTCAHAHAHCNRAMEKGRVRTERRSRSPQPRKELIKPISTVEEVSNEPQYIVDREKVRGEACYSK